MKRVLTAAVLIPLVLLVVFKAPVWLFTLVVGLFATLASLEYLAITSVSGITKRTAILVVVLFFCGTSFLITGSTQAPRDIVVLAGVFSPFVAPFVFLVLTFRHDDFAHGLREAALATFLLPYVVFSLASLIAVRDIGLGSGWFFILLLFAIVWSGDIFAYYVGKNFGRNKLAPRISPGKSWEGAIASVVGASVIAIFFVQFSTDIQASLASYGVVPAPTASGESGSGIPTLGPAPIWITLLIAITLNTAAQVGDLAESMIKRAAGVKDSGTLFPGHGGVLDRIDALLFAAPVAAILFTSLQHYFFRNSR
jgi:phosphatidate cytidylyltransferase